MDTCFCFWEARACSPTISFLLPFLAPKSSIFVSVWKQNRCPPAHSSSLMFLPRSSSSCCLLGFPIGCRAQTLSLGFILQHFCTTLFIPQHFSCYITFPQHFSTTLFIPLSLHLCCVSRTVPWHEAACLFAATTQHNVLLVCNVLLSNACVWLCCSPVGVCLHINCLAMASNQLFTY